MTKFYSFVFSNGSKIAVNLNKVSQIHMPKYNQKIIVFEYSRYTDKWDYVSVIADTPEIAKEVFSDILNVYNNNGKQKLEYQYRFHEQR